MDRAKPKTYNELIFNSFEKNRKKGGESNVKLERAKEKLWRGPSQLARLNSKLSKH